MIKMICELLYNDVLKKYQVDLIINALEIKLACKQQIQS